MCLRPITIIVIYDIGDHNIININIVVSNSQLLLTVLDGDKSFVSGSVSLALGRYLAIGWRLQLKC